jgi:hypothetical protein
LGQSSSSHQKRPRKHQTTHGKRLDKTNAIRRGHLEKVTGLFSLFSSYPSIFTVLTLLRYLHYSISVLGSAGFFVSGK